MTETAVFLYSGQGSQYFQMGRELFERHTSFQKHMRRLDGVAQSLTGKSVLAEIYNPNRKRSDVFDNLRMSHAAIFMVESALTQVLLEASVRPSYVLAASMGSFAAAVAAGCLEVEEGLRATLKQAEIFENYCTKGGMIALFEKSRQWVEKFAAQHGVEVAAANDSSPSVIAAPEAALGQFEAVLKKLGVAYQRLAVPYAFHSRWIDAAEKPYREFLATLPLRPARIPIVCCGEAEVLHRLPEGFFWNVGRKRIRLEEALTQLRSSAFRFIDVGPSGSLATALKYWFRDRSVAAETHTVLQPFGNDMTRLRQVVSTFAAA